LICHQYSSPVHTVAERKVKRKIHVELIFYIEFVIGSYANNEFICHPYGAPGQQITIKQRMLEKMQRVGGRELL
jgi:hypothetical protein